VRRIADSGYSTLLMPDVPRWQPAPGPTLAFAAGLTDLRRDHADRTVLAHQGGWPTIRTPFGADEPAVLWAPIPLTTATAETLRSASTFVPEVLSQPLVQTSPNPFAIVAVQWARHHITRLDCEDLVRSRSGLGL
jgi:hypothetical protein